MVEMGGTYTSRRRMRQWFTYKKGKSRDACRESRGTHDRDTHACVLRGWFRHYDPDRVRISRLCMAWLSLLPSKLQIISQSASRPFHGRSVWRDLCQNHFVTLDGSHRGDDQTRPAIDTVSSHLGNCRTPRSASCILWWMDRRFMFVPQDQWSPRRKSTLHRCHFWISVGEQIQNLSRGTSTDFNKSSDHWSIRLLWHRQSGYCNTRRIVKSCLTLSKWRKIDFSVMLYLCGTTTSITDARPPMDLYSHPSRMPHPQYVVYTWNQ